MDMHNTALIESLLFYKGGTMTLKELEKTSGLTRAEIEESLTALKTLLEGRGVRVVREGESVGLTTAPEAAAVIEAARREELEGPLGRAGLETLAVIMYRGAVTRADVEYIRGVNASQILRTLMIRGLIERVENPNDKRSFLYRATPELPAHLGLGEIKDLPDYSTVLAEITTVLNERDAQKEAPRAE